MKSVKSLLKLCAEAAGKNDALAKKIIDNLATCTDSWHVRH